MEANNMAAMREALVGLMDGICFHCDLSGDCKGTPCEKMQKAKAALAAPARNCDRYATADEALKAHKAAFEEDNFKNGECKLGCPGCDEFGTKCEVRWLLAPATERKGEDDGSK